MSQPRDSIGSRVQQFINNRVSAVKSLAKSLTKSNQDMAVSHRDSDGTRDSRRSSNFNANQWDKGSAGKDMCVGCSCDFGPFDCEGSVCRACVFNNKPSSSNILLKPWFGTLYLTDNQKKNLDMKYKNAIKSSRVAVLKRRETEDSEAEGEGEVIQDADDTDGRQGGSITQGSPKGSPRMDDMDGWQEHSITQGSPKGSPRMDADDLWKRSQDIDNGGPSSQTENRQSNRRRKLYGNSSDKYSRNNSSHNRDCRNSNNNASNSRSNNSCHGRDCRNSNNNTSNSGRKNRCHGRDCINSNNKSNNATNVTRRSNFPSGPSLDLKKCGCFLDEEEQNATFPNWELKTKAPNKSCPCKRVEQPEEWQSRYRVLASGYVELPHGHLGKVDIMGLDDMLPKRDLKHRSKTKQKISQPEPESDGVEDTKPSAISLPRAVSQPGSIRDDAPGITKGTLGTQIVRVKIPESMHKTKKKRHGFHGEVSVCSQHTGNTGNTDKHWGKRHQRRH